MSLFHAVVVTVAWLRKNPAQAAAADFLNISRPTVPRIFRCFRPVVAAALAGSVPDAAPACTGGVPLADGTLVPTANRAGQPELHAARRHRAGLNGQVLATARRRLLTRFAPRPGSTHDAEPLRRTELAQYVNLDDVAGDLGYLGTGVTTGIGEPPGRDPTGAQREVNRAITEVRVPVEHVGAQPKPWQILATGYADD